MSDNNANKKQKIVDFLEDLVPKEPPAKPVRKRRPPAAKASTPAIPDQKPGTIYVNGNGNVVAGGHVTQNITHIYGHHKPAQTKPVVKTADGVLDATQKGELLRLRDEIVDTHNAVHKTKLITQAAVMISLNRHLGVNTYHEIPMERFGEARSWMQQWAATIRNMKSAPAKVSNWRSKTIVYIKARCKNQLGDDQIYKPYIEKKFQKSSLAQLTDPELQTVKQYVAGLPVK